MKDAILVLNAGSSSIKFSMFAERAGNLDLLIKGQIEGIYTTPKFSASDHDGNPVGSREWDPGTRLEHGGAIDYLIEFLRTHRGTHELRAVGHRVVHGGTAFSKPTLITADVIRSLTALVPLAPLHQPHNLAPIGIVAERMPQLAQVACFDTAFHHGQPEVAQAFALPPSITDRGVKRYGFHGLSYEYIASALPGVDKNAAAGRTVVAHLGNGASMCAMKGSRSMASTMGFTAVDGLPMGTRSGALDPGVMLYLMDEMKMDVRAIEKLIYQQSGLLGVSGVSSDMRALLASAEPRAKLAIDIFVYRIGRELGSLSAATGGLDALVFTAGIGEKAAVIRERVCRDAAWLGVEFDAAGNATDGPLISTTGSRVKVWVMPTNEELMIARHTRRLAGA
ncbi:MAG: acetate/propionate family kinase [Betaproteobacteria bacterium]|nr:acetate/propionate family kinase [Betaproteobacteria bacterium]